MKFFKRKKVEPKADQSEGEKSAPSISERLRQALKKTRNSLSDVLSVPREINPEFLEDLESSLIVADIGAETTDEIIESLTLSMNRNELKDSEAVKMALKNLLLERLSKIRQSRIYLELKNLL